MLSYLPESREFPFKKNVAPGFIPYNGDSPRVIKMIMTTYTWSPIVFKNEYRHEKNFISSEYVALDFDEGVTIAEVLNTFCDTWHILGTTRSHQKQKGDKPPCDRFRLLLKATRVSEDLREYKYTMRHYVNEYRADKACKDGARYFFPCEKIVSEFTEDDAYYEEWKVPPSEEEEAKAAAKREAYTENRIDHGIMPSYSRWCLTNFIPVGEQSVACWKMGKELCLSGLSYEEALSRILASPTYRDRVVSPSGKVHSQLKAGYEQIQKQRGPKPSAS